MLQSFARSTPRRILVSKLQFRPASARQFLSTAPLSQKKRSWKGVAARWAIAIGAVYFYNTSPVFADQPNVVIAQSDRSLHSIQESKPPTLEAIAEEKKMRQTEQNARDAQTAKQNQNENNESQKEGAVEELEEGEEESDQQGAFNPETGEINWECPCLGGMAHGPCGDEFKAAFSCFVYSKEEPKGMECIGKFKDMQDCFRQHPETYSSELAGDEDEDEIEGELKAGATIEETEQSTTTSLPSAEATTSLAQMATPQMESRKYDLGGMPR